MTPLAPSSALPVATYRIQLRDGVDFAAVERQLPELCGLGVSHLYLSPIFTANEGSSHGYDITDPTCIDPVLGGREGFSALAAAARGCGLGLILDIVPNHTAFSLENPWLCDVLRHGPESRYAPHFDIDWSKGRLVLPFLPEPFEEMLDRGAFRIEAAGEGHVLTDGLVAVPLAPGALPVERGWADPATLRDVHDRQHWRLTHWEYERDGVTHRRFFNVTGLIGMRVEKAEVFDDMHRLVFELIGAGEVQGLRVDHVDGLADPAGYLRRLRRAVGDRPVWVEKILTGDEPLPDWPVAGTTGYEAARIIVCLLTDPGGLARLDAAWRAATGRTGGFAEALAEAKREVIRQELAAELHALIGLARAAEAEAGAIEAGDEALREAVMALLVAFPRYRTYLTDGFADPDDLRLMDRVADAAAEELRSDRTLRFVAALVTEPAGAPARASRTRFQQVTGALTAKAHEDTAGFRYTRYLAANEVGAEPDETVMTAGEVSRWLAARPAGGLTLTSSHDTKRAEDARMRLVALSHLPSAFLALWDEAARLPGAGAVDAGWRWYVLQSFLAMWEAGRDDIEERLVLHLEKAMREAKEETSWSHPRPEAEEPVQDFARTLVRAWALAPPAAASGLLARGEDLSLAQVALKMLMPGIPDLYRGTEGPAYELTDPDNRGPVDPEALARLPQAEGFPGRKARLTRALIALRRERPDFFATASARVEGTAPGPFVLIREAGEERVVLTIAPGAAAVGPRDPLPSVWPAAGEDAGGPVAVEASWRGGGADRTAGGAADGLEARRVALDRR